MKQETALKFSLCPRLKLDQRFRRMRRLQMFVSIHASVTNHFNLERSLTSRSNFKLNRTAALAEWRQRLAGE